MLFIFSCPLSETTYVCDTVKAFWGLGTSMTAEITCGNSIKAIRCANNRFMFDSFLMFVYNYHNILIQCLGFIYVYTHTKYICWEQNYVLLSKLKNISCFIVFLYFVKKYYISFLLFVCLRFIKFYDMF